MLTPPIIHHVLLLSFNRSTSTSYKMFPQILVCRKDERINVTHVCVCVFFC
jgi:hypothetical protein